LSRKKAKFYLNGTIINYMGKIVKNMKSRGGRKESAIVVRFPLSIINIFIAKLQTCQKLFMGPRVVLTNWVRAGMQSVFPLLRGG
jgi:hypothetical protein